MKTGPREAVERVVNKYDFSRNFQKINESSQITAYYFAGKNL